MFSLVALDTFRSLCLFLQTSSARINRKHFLGFSMVWTDERQLWDGGTSFWCDLMSLSDWRIPDESQGNLESHQANWKRGVNSLESELAVALFSESPLVNLSGASQWAIRNVYYPKSVQGSCKCDFPRYLHVEFMLHQRVNAKVGGGN